ncbi:MAG: alanine racemase [Egibacteraceae bacterium]
MTQSRMAVDPGGPPEQRPTWAEVDLDAIAANVVALKAQAATSRLMAVVKADAYGHGLVPAARAALAGGADWLAVALVEEGRALRAAGVGAPILVLAEPPPAAAGPLLDAGLTPAVYTPAFINALDHAATDRSGEPVGVHLKLDTGMRRVGVPQAGWEDVLRQVRASVGLRLEGLWSHFAVAGEPEHPFIAHQSREFRRGVDLAASLGMRPDLIHLCNSAGTLHLHEDHYDMVRPGLAIYGLEPAPGLAASCPLRPALSFRSRLSLVKPLAAGEAVSYGLRWTAQTDTTVGTVPAGYADGVVRALSNRGEVVVRGRRVPIVGMVCMDQFLVDVGNLDARAGDDVVLIGAQDGAAVTAEDWATWLGTANYEIVCGVGKRVPRVYVGAAGRGVDGARY